MNMNLNRSAQAASEQFQALADQEKALVNNVLSAIKSAFSSEPSYSNSLNALMDRGGEYSHRLLANVYRHPVAAALSVIGAGCLFYGLRRSQSDGFSAYHQSSASYGVDPEYIDEWGEPIPATERAEAGVKAAMKDAKERADELTPQAREYARNVGARASQLGREAQAHARTAGQQLQGRSQQFSAQARDTIRQHPIAVGVIGVALGVAVGGAIYGNSRRNRRPAFGALSGKGISDQNLARAAAFFNNSSSSAKEALLNARKRMSH